MTKSYPGKSDSAISPSSPENLRPSDDLLIRGAFHCYLRERNNNKYKNKHPIGYTFLLQ